MKHQKTKKQFMLFSLISFFIYAVFFIPSSYAATKTVDKLDRIANIQVHSPIPELSKVALSLALILFVLFLLSYLIKKFNLLQRVNGTSAMKIIACMPLSTKERLMLVEIGESAVLLGHTQGQIECLHVFDKTPELKSENQAEQNTFVTQLAKAVRAGEK